MLVTGCGGPCEGLGRLPADVGLLEAVEGGDAIMLQRRVVWAVNTTDAARRERPEDLMMTQRLSEHGTFVRVAGGASSRLLLIARRDQRDR